MYFRHPDNVRFECSMCGLCCGDTPQKTRRILMLEQEAVEISAATSMPTEDFADEAVGKAPYGLEMKKQDGKCVFLKKDNKCTIYAFRPLICMFYPFELKFDKNSHVFDFTLECPGINRGKTVDAQYFKRLFELALQRIR